MSLGFETKYQYLGPDLPVKDENNLDYDSYVYKYGFNEDYTSQILYEEEISRNEMRRQLTFTS